MLWNAGHLVGLIDWEDVALGDPVIDLANARLEMLWAFGHEAMDMFTQRYLAQHPIEISTLPYWDLYAALRPMFRLSEWADSPAAEAHMRERHHLFVAQALQALGLQG